MGWDKLRDARLARMKKLDIVAADQELSTRPEVERFESLTPEQKDHNDLLMATYAGMIDRVDQNLGRLLDKLRALGETDNTLVLFLSDNGACPFQRSQKKTIERGLMPWDPESFWTYDTRWAFACNTPWRKFKQNQHEGGISTPLIAYWPSGMKNPGRLERQRGHLVDLHATFRELSGVAFQVLLRVRRSGRHEASVWRRSSAKSHAASTPNFFTTSIAERPHSCRGNGSWWTPGSSTSFRRTASSRAISPRSIRIDSKG